MITDPFQRKVYDAVSAALPFAIDPANITVEPGVSYPPSPIKLHDYAVGVMAAFGSVIEHLGRVRGLPAQTMTLNRRLSGFHLNELQVQLLNGYSLVLDTWPVGADNGTYRTKDGRYVHTIPVEIWEHMKTVLRARNWSDKEFALATNTRFDGPRMWTHAPGRARLHRIAFIFAESQLHDLATNDIYWHKVVEVVSIGRREIADVNEEMGHAVVQGILVRPELN